MDDNDLALQLFRHPWLDHATARQAGVEDTSWRSSVPGSAFSRVELPGAGTCLARPGYPAVWLALFWRLTMVRRFILAREGRGVFLAGFTPGPVADGEFPSPSGWLRVWADMGGCAPEALRWVCHPPQTFGPRVQDVILTVDAARIPLLAAQLERAWGASTAVEVCAWGSSEHQIVHPHGGHARPFTPYSRAEMGAALSARLAPAPRIARLGSAARCLTPQSWDMLISIGNNPLLTRAELELLLSETAREEASVAHRLHTLITKKLLEGSMWASQERLSLSWRALELLALYWGCELPDMARWLPWPQRRDRWGHWSYSLRWAHRLEAHTRILRQFALAVIDGARRLSLGPHPIRMELITLIGSRVLFTEKGTGEHAVTRWVAPDGVLRAARSTRSGANESKEAERWELLLEIDRATNALPRVEERLAMYARVWGALERRRKITLVWVIDGAPSRERQILEKMRAHHLPGWTVTLERLVLAPRDPYWCEVPAASMSFSYAMVGGMAPLRPIWQHTDGGKDLLLLGRPARAGARAAKMDWKGVE